MYINILIKIEEMDIKGVNTQDIMHDLIFFASGFYDVIGRQGEKADEIVKKINVLVPEDGERINKAILDVRRALGACYDDIRDIHTHKREM